MTTQYEARQQKRPTSKPPYLCTRGACDLPKWKDDLCRVHLGTPEPAVAEKRPRAPRHTKHVPPPLKWCSYHQTAHMREVFGKDKARGDGLAANCKAANRELQAMYHGKGRQSMGAGRAAP